MWIAHKYECQLGGCLVDIVMYTALAEFLDQLGFSRTAQRNVVDRSRRARLNLGVEEMNDRMPCMIE